MNTELPTPSLKRWQPLRCGVLNLYKYDDQVFVFEGGRLLLRGNNGTGKSRVLALTLPFLFDGRTESHRVEPDADPAKKMEWNLLMGKIDDRTGYSWIEFGRQLDDGSHEYLTLGCGLRASQGRKLQHWHFITPRRVGPDLQLTKNKAPHTEATLTQVLEGSGKVFRDATTYRAAVDQQLFGLGPRYDALLNLLIQLRKPQLTRKLDEEQLSRALSEGLPPLSPKVLEDVAEAFRELDEQRGQLGGYRDAHDAVQEFLEKYRHYVQVAVRIRAKAMMKAHREWHDKGRAIRHHEKEWEDAEAAYLVRKAEKESREIEASGLTAKVQALKQDPALQDMESARQAAEQTAAHEKDMQAELQTARSRMEASKRECDAAVSAEATSLADARGNAAHASKAASEAILDVAHKDALAAIDLQTLGSEEDAESARSLLEDPIKRREAAIKALQVRVSEVENAERELAGALKKVEERTSAVTAAEENERTKHREMEAAGESLAHDYRTWVGQLRELRPMDADQMDVLLDEWMEHQTGAIPVRGAVADAHREAEKHLAAGEAKANIEIAALRSREDEVGAMLDALNRGRHEPPTPPPTRDPSVREWTAGAPLWRLCDFHDSFPEERRANLEAALEASGLLDSWVLPDGGWLGPDQLDVALSHHAEALPTGTPTLLDALRADVANLPDGFPEATVTGVLARVGLGERAGSVWVAPSGAWQIGPLRGAWRKGSAQHIGASAREANRQRRIQELSEQAATLANEISELETQIAEIAKQREAATNEAATAPGDDALRTAVVSVGVAKEQLAQARQKLTAAEAERRTREQERDACVTKRDKDARDFGLFDHINRLDALTESLREYEKSLLMLWPGLHKLARARLHTAQVRLRAEADQAQAARRGETFQDAQTKAAAALSHYETLRKKVGAGVDEVLANLAVAESDLASLSTTIKADVAALEGLSRTSAAALASKEAAETDLPQFERNRSGEAAHLMELARQRLLTVAADEFKAYEAADRTVDETFQLARELDRVLQQVPFDPEHWQDQQTSIHSHVGVLVAELLPHNFPPTTSLTSDGVLVVTVPYQGAMQTMTEIRMALATEMTTRETQLTQDEQKVIEKYLLNEAAQELHERLRDAEQWKNDASEELQSRPMGSGMRLRFAWETRSEGFPGLREAIKLLHQQSSMWSEQERKDLGAFLGDRIREAHRNSEKGEWKDHLAQALDYREWHIFTVERWQDGHWDRLTKKKHGTGSGGEKAVALTLPQFTAAAAFYRTAPNAPRLIMLDEAFVGVDRDMRRKCMDLLTTFDLDLVMTSESEWGCYPTVPALAIYQLASSPDAVAATRWVWNGREQRLDDTPHIGASDTEP